MRSMIIFCAILAFAVAAGGFLAYPEKPVNQESLNHAAVGATGPIESERTSVPSTKAIPEPPALTGFRSWSRQAQLNAITAIESNPRLDDQVVAFLGYELAADRSLDDITRNNIANALLIQSQAFTTLPETLIHMVNDRNESSTWRAYALQHLATAFERVNGGDQQILKALQSAMADPDNSVACTAMIQLNRLERDKFLKLDPDYAQTVISRLRSKGNDDPVVGISIIPLLGERREKAALPEIRPLAQDSDPHVRRVAIAALGRMGDVTDLALMRRSLDDGNELVEMAARGAIARLEKAEHK